VSPNDRAKDERHHDRVDDVLMQNKELRQKGSHADNRQQEGVRTENLIRICLAEGIT
jgi:hypothetical protein